MAKKNQTMQDVLAALTNTNTVLVDSTNEKVVSRKKTDIPAIAADIFEIDAQLAALDKESKDFDKNVKELKAKRSHIARQRYATAFSNIPKAELEDRTDEGIAALRKKMEESRYGMYDAEYDNDDLPEKVKIAGKEQDIRFTSGEKKGKPKYAAWNTTKRTWNIGSQFMGDVDKYGWAEVVKAGKVVPYKDTQKWTTDEDGNIIKEKAKGGVTPPADGYALIEAAIKSLEQRINRKDVDLTSKKGSDLADKAMLAISKAVVAAKAAAK